MYVRSDVGLDQIRPSANRERRNTIWKERFHCYQWMNSALLPLELVEKVSNGVHPEIQIKIQDERMAVPGTIR